MNASHDQMDSVDRARLVESSGARVDSPSWNLDRVKQPQGSGAEGREGVRAGSASVCKESGRMQERREYDETSRQR